MRIFIIYFLLFFTLPCLFVLVKLPSLNFFLILISQSFFLVPFLYKFKHANGGLRYDNYIISVGTFYAILILYYLVDYNTINGIITSIFQNEYLKNGLEKASERYSGNEIVLFETRIRIIIGFLLFLSIPIVPIHLLKKISVCILLFIIESATFSRSGIVISFVSMLAVYILYKRRELITLSNKKLIKSAIVLCLFAMLIFAFSGFGRVYDKANPIEIILEKFGKYSLANYEALAVWAQTYDYSYMGLGSETFGFINKLLGVEKVAGNYLPIQTSYGETNLYTVTRSIYEDFWIFSSIFWLLIGYNCIRAFQSNSLNKVRYGLGLSSIIIVFYWFYSPFYFNSYLLSFLLFIILLKKPIEI